MLGAGSALEACPSLAHAADEFGVGGVGETARREAAYCKPITPYLQPSLLLPVSLSLSFLHSPTLPCFCNKEQQHLRSFSLSIPRLRRQSLTYSFASPYDSFHFWIPPFRFPTGDSYPCLTLIQLPPFHIFITINHEERHCYCCGLRCRRQRRRHPGQG